MNRGALILVFGGAAALGGFLWWHHRQAGQGASLPPATAPAAADFIGQAKAAALAPAPAPKSSATSSSGGFLSAAVGFLGSLLNSTAPQPGQGTAPAQGYADGATIAETPRHANPAPSAPVFSLGTSLGTTAATAAGIDGLLNVIAGGEAGPAGYDAVYSGARLAPPQPVSSMTVGQVLDYQAQSIAAGSKSSAVGRYQFLHSTLQGLVNQGAISASAPFNKATQDTAATALLNRRGLAQYQAGQLSADQFANNLAHEWASLPLVTGPNQGASAYASDGLNAARVSVPTIMKSINNAG